MASRCVHHGSPLSCRLHCLARALFGSKHWGRRREKFELIRFAVPAFVWSFLIVSAVFVGGMRRDEAECEPSHKNHQYLMKLF